jgi:hypothetical protein
VADTRLLKNQVERYVRGALEKEFGQQFTTQVLIVGKRSDGFPASHEFDAVSADGRIVAGIKSSSGKTSSGRRPSGKIAAAYKELYFLSLVDAERRILVLTDPEFYKIMENDCDGRLAPGLELMLIPLSLELASQVQTVHKTASQEMSAGAPPGQVVT